MRVLWLVVVAAAVAGLAACAQNVREESDPRGLFADGAFAPPAQSVAADGLFTLDADMRAFFRRVIVPNARRLGPEQGLFQSLRDSLSIDYDAAVTRTAAETFAARSGNCLSLVILTGAFARELRVPVRYQVVSTASLWTRSGGIAFLSGHVNVVLGDAVIDRDGGRTLVIDFVPGDALPARSARAIDERTLVAMYLNNRAAEFLAQGDPNEAYWLAREAVLRAPTFVPAYNTLGVVYLRHGDLPQAEAVLRHAASRAPDDPQVLSNLEHALSRQGRTDEANAIGARLAAIEPYPPYFFLEAGLEALRRGDTLGSLALFRKELRRMPYDDEVHFAIAVASLRLGETAGARRHLEQALENSTVRSRHDLYAAKLEYIKALQHSSD